jgi:hypothetical protein
MMNPDPYLLGSVGTIDAKLACAGTLAAPNQEWAIDFVSKVERKRQPFPNFCGEL